MIKQFSERGHRKYSKFRETILASLTDGRDKYAARDHVFLAAAEDGFSHFVDPVHRIDDLYCRAKTLARFMRPAKRMAAMPVSGTFRVFDLAKRLEKEGREIIHMEIGEPDFDTPEHIKRAAEEALRRGMTKYTPAAGMPELREAIAEHVGKKGIEAKAEEVLITPGAKHAIFCAMVAALDPGDEVIIPSPCWTYEGIAQVAGARTVYVKTSMENGFRLSADAVNEKLTPKSKMLLLNYPNNPTGAVADEGDLRALADLAVDHRLWVLSDEIYDCLVYEGKHVSIASFPDMHERTVYINGFSKAYAMTGWRLGYAIAPVELVAEMEKIQQASTSCAPAFVQAAGLAALRGPQECVEKMRDEYKKRRDSIVEGLNSIRGFECTKPRGAFYVFPNVEKIGLDSLTLCERLLLEGGIAAVPGSEFGPYGEGHVRFSYSTSIEKIRLAIGRIAEVTKKLQGR